MSAVTNHQTIMESEDINIYACRYEIIHQSIMESFTYRMIWHPMEGSRLISRTTFMSQHARQQDEEEEEEEEEASTATAAAATAAVSPLLSPFSSSSTTAAAAAAAGVSSSATATATAVEPWRRRIVVRHSTE